VDAEEADVFRVRVGDAEYEIEAHCPHLGGPLADGKLIGPFLRCPWHGATFDVRTGRRLRGPACRDLATRVRSATQPAQGGA
jgi:nitrite reductase/ring-hydroxylating ferredoxin subunit